MFLGFTSWRLKKLQEKFPKAKYSHKVLSPKAGYIFSINTEDFGKAAMILGAGRETKEEQIDLSLYQEYSLSMMNLY